MWCVYLLCLFVVLSCVEQPRHKINVLVSTVMSICKLVLRRNIIVENKDINFAPRLFHLVQNLLYVFVAPFCCFYLLGPFWKICAMALSLQCVDWKPFIQNDKQPEAVES